MDSISKQAVLLAKYKINSEDELINLFIELNKKMSKNKDNEELKDEISLIKEIRQRIKIEDNIRENEKEVLIR